MGIKKNRRFSSNEEEPVDSEFDHETIIDLPELHPLDRYLEQLFDKRYTKRENGLKTITDWLLEKVEHEYVEEKFATLLHRFLFSLKKGSSKEIKSASYAIGLLSIIVSSEDKSHEIYEESIPLLNKVLKSKYPDPMIFHCIAIVTLFGANNVDETESTMKYLWEFIDSDSGERMYSSQVLAAAISSWSLLISSMDQWKLNRRYWQGSISCFLNLLEDDDETVCLAAGEALGLIFDTGSIEKFTSKWDDEGSASAKETSNYATHEKSVKDNVLKKLKEVSIKLNCVKLCNGDWDIIQFLKHGSIPGTILRFKNQDLTLSTWSRKVQLKFFLSFLGVTPFGKHMLANEVFQDFFDFKPTQRSHSKIELYELSADEIVEPCVHLFCPLERSNKLTRNTKVTTMEKAKTILLKKQRQQAKMRNSDNIFASEDN